MPAGFHVAQAPPAQTITADGVRLDVTAHEEDGRRILERHLPLEDGLRSKATWSWLRRPLDDYDAARKATVILERTAAAAT